MGYRMIVRRAAHALCVYIQDRCDEVAGQLDALRSGTAVTAFHGASGKTEARFLVVR